MEIVLRTNEKKLIFSIHATGPAAVVGVYAADKEGSKGKAPAAWFGAVEFAELVRMAKAILATSPAETPD